MGEGSKTVIPFSGNKKLANLGWQVSCARWFTRIQGYPPRNGEIPTYNEFSEMESEPAKVKAKSLRKSNQDAFIDLLHSISVVSETGQIAFQIAKGLQNKGSMGWWCKSSMEEAEQQIQVNKGTKSIVVEKFVNSRLKSVRSDPDVWITQLEDLTGSNLLKFQRTHTHLSHDTMYKLYRYLTTTVLIRNSRHNPRYHSSVFPFPNCELKNIYFLLLIPFQDIHSRLNSRSNQESCQSSSKTIADTLKILSQDV